MKQIQKKYWFSPRAHQIKEWNVFPFRKKKNKKGVDMAKLVDVIDLIQLNLNKKIYQVLAFIFGLKKK
jgi:hypothetical protein